jgi:hypothetical protein
MNIEETKNHLHFLTSGHKVMNWREERQALENAYARKLLIEYNIREVTTQRQAKNGTREFKFPVSCFSKQVIKWNKGKNTLLKDRLRLAVFKNGYVRKQNGTYSPYQLNKTYKRETRYTFLSQDGFLYTRKSINMEREKIRTGLARMVYMLEYYKRNYAK